jgi:hypothetical protein
MGRLRQGRPFLTTNRNAPMNSYDLAGRVAIVTGGGQGIGLAVSELILANFFWWARQGSNL